LTRFLRKIGNDNSGSAEDIRTYDKLQL